MITKYSKEVLGTNFEIILEDKNDEVINLCFLELERIENKFSRFKKKSHLNQINSNLNTWQEIDLEFKYLIEKSLEISSKTKGHFDICLKSTLENLGYDSKYSFKEKKLINSKSKYNQIKKIFQRNIKIKDNKLYIREEIEFGGIGKGYALDKLSKILDEKLIEKYLINGGGDIVCKTKKIDDAWKIHLEHPEDNKKIIGEIKIRNGSIASSSSRVRKWKMNHHLINSKTKTPENSVKSIYVLSKKGIYSDAYATALFTSGFDRAIEISKKLNLEIFIISNKNQIYISKNFNVKLYD